MKNKFGIVTNKKENYMTKNDKFEEFCKEFGARNNENSAEIWKKVCHFAKKRLIFVPNHTQAVHL